MPDRPFRWMMPVRFPFSGLRAPTPIAAFATCAAFAAALVPLGASAAWQVEATSSRHADPTPLHRLDIDDVAGQFDPRPGRNLAYMDEQLRVSYQGGRDTWSLVARSAGKLVGTRDAFDMARSLETSGTPDRDQRWDVKATYRSFAGGGVAWQRDLVLSDRLQGWFGLEALALTQFREFELDGAAAYDAARREWQFGLQYRRNDSRLDLPFQDPYDGTGQALLTRGGLRWAGDGWTGAVAWRDAGRARWRGVPQQALQLSSSTRTYDGDGHVEYKPLLRGGYHQDTLHRSLPGIGTVRVGVLPRAGMEVGAGGDYLPGFGWLPQLDVRQRIDGGVVSVGYAVHERRLGLALDWRGWRLAFGADRFGDEARSRAFRIGYAWLGD